MDKNDVLKNLTIAKYFGNGVFEKDGKLYKVLSLSADPCEILENHDDEMKIVITCPNCGQPTEVGNTRSISGVVGCDNEYKGGSCYFDDLLPRELAERENKYK